jgi:hypothetical protein
MDIHLLGSQMLYIEKSAVGAQVIMLFIEIGSVIFQGN